MSAFIHSYIINKQENKTRYLQYDYNLLINSLQRHYRTNINFQDRQYCSTNINKHFILFIIEKLTRYASAA